MLLSSPYQASVPRQQQKYVREEAIYNEFTTYGRCWSSEESVVDLNAKRLVSLTRNIDHKKLVVATETIEYIPSRGDPDKTLMTRRTSIRSPLDGLTGRMIESVCHARTIRNVKRTLQVKKEKGRKREKAREREREKRFDFNELHRDCLENGQTKIVTQKL